MPLVDDNATAIQFLEAPQVSKQTFDKVIESRIAGEVLKRLVMMPFVVISYIGETVYKGMELIWIDAVNSN
jgi:hypothetical protein